MQTLNVALHPDWAGNLYNEIVYCQSLLFLTIASDRSGPGASANVTELLGRLVGRITMLNLNDAKTITSLRDQDRDTFYEARRLFWATFILDRFHASSQNRATILYALHATVSRDDYHALGEAGYHLARKCKIVFVPCGLTYNRGCRHCRPYYPSAPSRQRVRH